MSTDKKYDEGSHYQQTEHAFQSPKWGVLEAHDADQQAHNLKNWQQHYDQISDGAFYGRIEEVSFGDIHTFKEHTNLGIHQHCNVSPNALWIGFSANDVSCRINGCSVGSRGLMLRPGNTEFELVTPNDFTIFGIVIDQNYLQSKADRYQITLSPERLNTPIHHWPSHKIDQLKQIIEPLIHSSNIPSPNELHQQHLVMMLLDLFDTASPKSTSQRSLQKRRHVVKTVIEHVQSHPEFPASITALCQIAHVSRRTLQYSFEHVLGMSPVRYIRAIRLNQVRRALLQGCTEQYTIADLAQQYGFWHSGQFSHDYTQLFGENPSHTRQRHHCYSTVFSTRS